MQIIFYLRSTSLSLLTIMNYKILKRINSVFLIENIYKINLLLFFYYQNIMPLIFIKKMKKNIGVVYNLIYF